MLRKLLLYDVNDVESSENRNEYPKDENDCIDRLHNLSSDLPARAIPVCLAIPLATSSTKLLHNDMIATPVYGIILTSHGRPVEPAYDKRSEPRAVNSGALGS